MDLGEIDLWVVPFVHHFFHHVNKLEDSKLNKLEDRAKF
jgi:hypothetical protein